MIEAAEAIGELKPGGTIVEPTSGNTGVGLALVAQRKGYRCVFVCPDKVSQDKRDVLRAYGAEVVVTPTAVAPDHPRLLLLGLRPARAEIPGRLEAEPVRQPERPGAATTSRPARRSGRDTDGRVTHFVAGVGTGGTITGTGRYLHDVSDGRRRSSSAPTPPARSTPAATDGRTSSRASARTSGRPPTTRPCPTRSSPSPTRTRSR